MKNLRPITQEEWEQYEWIDVTAQDDEDPVYTKGIKKTLPPQDGFIYVEKTPFNSPEQVWKRVMTYA